MSKLAISLATLTIALGCAGSAAATPVTRVVAPAGSGIECSVQTPCSYAYAINAFGSNAGDTVLALPGTYDVSPAPVDVAHRLTIIGDPALPRPVFTTSDPQQNTFTVENAAAGTVLKHLDIRAIGAFEGLRANGRVEASDMAISGTFRCAMFFADGSVLEDSTLTGEASPGGSPLCLDTSAAATFRRLSVSDPTGTGVLLEYGGATLEDSTITAQKPLRLTDGPGTQTIRRVSLFGTDYGLAAVQSADATVTDSVIAASGGATAVMAYFNNSTLHLRSDTIIATAAGASGIEVSAATSGLAAGQVDARNVIVKAAGRDLLSDVAANPASCTPAPCAPGALAIDHSAFADSNGPLLDGGSNVTGDPAFVNAATLDFHLAPGSPAIDAGVADLLTQGTDRDGHVRFQGRGLDLGAYEATPAPALSAAGADAATPAVPARDAAVAPDLLAPVLSHARVTNRV